SADRYFTVAYYLLPTCLFTYSFIFSACSSASSMAPTYMNACSGRWSHLPSQISLNDRIGSPSGVKLPPLPVKTSATKNGWEYVEGYATSLLPVGHAWCLDGEDIVETTWDTAGAEYRGIVFPLDYVAALTLVSDHWGVLGNDYLDNFPLLEKGMTSNHPTT
ncbi:hypothetical protein LCGC14_2363190, partial [marine sediment metagenome]